MALYTPEYQPTGEEIAVIALADQSDDIEAAFQIDEGEKLVVPQAEHDWPSVIGCGFDGGTVDFRIAERAAPQAVEQVDGRGKPAQKGFPGGGSGRGHQDSVEAVSVPQGSSRARNCMLYKRV